MVVKKRLSRGSTTQQSHNLSYQHTVTLVVAVTYRTQSGMHSPQELRHLWEIVQASCYASAMEQNLCRLLHSVSYMSHSTQLSALVHLLSRWYAPAAYTIWLSRVDTLFDCTILLVTVFMQVVGTCMYKQASKARCRSKRALLFRHRNEPSKGCMCVHYERFNPLSDCTLRSLEWKRTHGIRTDPKVFFICKRGKQHTVNLPPTPFSYYNTSYTTHILTASSSD